MGQTIRWERLRIDALHDSIVDEQRSKTHFQVLLSSVKAVTMSQDPVFPNLQDLEKLASISNLLLQFFIPILHLDSCIYHHLRWS